MSSCNKKSVLRTVFTANGSCGCAKTKAIEVHEPTPKAKFTSNTINHKKITKLGSSSKTSSATTSGERNGAVSIDDDGEEFSSTTVSEAETISTTSYYASKRSPLINSVAVEKDSEDPYHDFRHSMLQMIFEKEIDSEEDLQELLQCFLHLNATCYHRVIVKAFNEICQEAFPHNDNNDKVSAATAQPSASSNTSHVIIRKK